MNNKINNTKFKLFNVCLFGASLDTNNMGVSALTASLIKLILDIDPNALLYLLIGNRSSKPQKLKVSGKIVNVNVVNYRLSPKAQLQEHLFWIFLKAVLWRILPFRLIRKRIINTNLWLKTLLKADFVGDIWKGDSFSDIYGLKWFLIESIPRIIAALLHKKIVFLPQTYGPFKSYISRKIAHFILVRSKSIYSRDKESIKTVKKLLGKKECRTNIYFCHDLAFTLDSTIPKEVTIQPSIKQRHEVTLIGVNVNGLMYNGGYNRKNMFVLKFDYKKFIHKLVKRLLEEFKADILLIPHTFGPQGHISNDQDACRNIFRSFNKNYKDRIYMVVQQYDQYEIKGIIGFCDFFIGSRMHSCIAALSQGISTIGIAYSKKFIGVFDSIDLGQMIIDARLHDMETSINNTLELFRNHLNDNKSIEKKMEHVYKTIKIIFSKLIDEYVSI